MNTNSLRAAPAAGLPLPEPGAPAPRLTGFRRATDVAEGILYWGLLGLGVLLPFVGALYGLMRA